MDRMHISIVSRCKDQITRLQSILEPLPGVNLDTPLMYSSRNKVNKQSVVGPGIVFVDSATRKDILLRQIKDVSQRDPAVKIILVYDADMPLWVEEILEFDIVGIIKTDAGPAMFQRAIDAVKRGDLWLPRKLICQAIALLLQQHKSLVDSRIDNSPGTLL